MLPFSDGAELHRSQSFGHIFLESIEGVITVLAQIPLHHTPEILNKIELTVEFGKEDTQVSACFNDLLDQGLLFLEVWLKVKSAFFDFLPIDF